MIWDDRKTGWKRILNNSKTLRQKDGQNHSSFWWATSTRMVLVVDGCWLPNTSKVGWIVRTHTPWEETSYTTHTKDSTSISYHALVFFEETSTFNQIQPFQQTGGTDNPPKRMVLISRKKMFFRPKRHPKTTNVRGPLAYLGAGCLPPADSGGRTLGRCLYDLLRGWLSAHSWTWHWKINRSTTEFDRMGLLNTWYATFTYIYYVLSH